VVKLAERDGRYAKLFDKFVEALAELGRVGLHVDAESSEVQLRVK
jgi:hypothetical protein